MEKVLITRRISDDALALIRNSGYETTVYAELKNISQDELIKMCEGHVGLLSVGPNQIDEHFLGACPQLKGIALMSVGYDKVDLEAANKHRMPISNTPDVLSEATADTAFLLMLSVARNAFYMHKSIERGEWNFFDPMQNLGQELYGKTLGVLGLGRIGLEMAKKAKAAYGMDIIYHNRNRNEQAEKELGAKYLSFDELLQQSDVLTVHVNLTEETKGLFDKSAFSKMKPNAIFINTARGAIHNEEDLLLALQNGTIWGAGLDVTNPEPMDSNNPLLNMENVCVLPHIGSATKETREKMAMMAAENIVAALKGERMPQVINPEVYK
ncbi:2-hydroxyacid dehydrogenase [Pedobacter xixiisoli]|uniref:Glyoxylate/hydroxypyruvate reductase B n=1 Tax=Pedobacter xixiisoli TaxID=1476464 RepID=A0A286A7R0_9SPHI|nr:D-glycerate dehydrogenase [Pedobacter xixiisoli]SOD17935.1 Lactate dehydrogenase [Pedobacter xixiisoli]